MRSGDGYMAKLWPEMDVIKSHLFHGTELSEKDERTFQQIEFVRTEIMAGHSQYQVLLALKSTFKIQERRSREVLWMTYNVFADLGLTQNEAGKRFVYENIYQETAQKVMEMVEEAREHGEFKEVASLLKVYKDLVKEAATLGGAYNKALPGGIDPAQYERPIEVSFQIKAGTKKQLNLETGEVTEVVDIDNEEDNRA